MKIMTLKDYIIHYLSFSQLVKFTLISSCVVFMIHMILMLIARNRAVVSKKENKKLTFLIYFGVLTEEYYELMFSSSCILFFTGVYFLISYNYFSLSPEHWQFWLKYEGYILLGVITVSVVFNNLIDRLFVPLRRLDSETRGVLRMAGMFYMLIIFAYIKFIDQNSNYDTILGYFITLVIGRFVYFDASAKDFVSAVKKIWEMLPAMILVLASTALLSLYGFKVGYLLRSNGVVVSLFIAHFFCILEICITYRTKFFEKLSKKILF